MSVAGFNVGSGLSLEDLSLAIDYLLNKDIFDNELRKVKNKINVNDSSIENSIEKTSI